MSRDTVFLVALLTYVAIITGLGSYWMRRAKSATDFLMAGRNLGIFVLIGTTLATTIGTGSTMGTVGLAYTGGWSGALWAFGLGTGMIIVGLLFAPMRRYGLMTLGEEITCYYGKHPVLMHTANFGIFISMVCWIGVHIMGGGLYLMAMIDVPFMTGAIIATVGFAGVTILGGYLAVVYTDAIQSIILTVGFLGLTFYTLQYVGGFSGITAAVPPEYLSFLGVDSIGWKKVISIPIALCLSMIPEPSFRHRIYSARSAQAGRRSFLITGVLAILFSFAMVTLGMAAYALNPSLAMQDQALPWLALEVLPVWFAAVIIICGFAASLSSADSDAATGAVFFVRHIWHACTGRFPEKSVMMSRWVIAGMFLVALLVVLQFQNIVDYVVTFISVVLSGLAVVVLLGRFWPRATAQGAVAAIVCGAVVSLCIIVIPGQKEFWGEAIIPATIAAVLGEVIVSLCTPPEKLSFEELVEVTRVERELFEKASGQG
jgi:solute:Na+ symporter, SSS family